MSIKNIALINASDQVINIVVVDTDDNSTINALHEVWGTVRWAEYELEKDVIILDPSPEIWTTHNEETGFTPPFTSLENTEQVQTVTEVTINGRKYPSDSKLIKENAHLRPAGWVLPEGQQEVSLADAE